MPITTLSSDKSILIKNFDIDSVQYRYAFDQMDLNRIIEAEDLFRIHERMFQNMPLKENELHTATMRLAKQKALSCLIGEVMDDLHIKAFDPAIDLSIEKLSHMQGSQYKALKECQADFFSNTGIVSEESIGQLKSIMTVFSEESGRLSPEQQMLLFTAMKEATINASTESQPTNSAPTITTPENIMPSVAPSTMPNLSGLQATETQLNVERS